MQILVSGIPYQNLRKSYPEITLPIPDYFSSIPYEKINSLIFVLDKETLEEIKALNSFFPFFLNVQIGISSEHLHELLSLKPAKATLSNLQRKDNCIDFLIFKEQIYELLQNFQYPKENLYARIEADPEQLKATSKLGFSRVEIDFIYPFQSEREEKKFKETISLAQKMGISISFGKGMDLFNLKKILNIYKPDELVIDYPFYQIAFKKGIEKAIDFILSIVF